MAAERVVYVVDDDAAVCRSLKRLLETAGFRTMFYAMPSAFLDVAKSLPVGCALLDVRMPEMDGFELQARLQEMKVGLPVIVVTAQGDVQGVVRAMKAGAVDFIEKPYDDETLISAIEFALKRGARADRSIEITEAAARIAKLSRREHEVLDALALGHSNKVIANDLGISVRTVDVHRARMMDRLDVRQFADAIRLAILARLAGQE